MNPHQTGIYSTENMINEFVIMGQGHTKKREHELVKEHA